MPRLTVEGLCKSFGTQRVVDNVSFTVAPGELFSLLGPSGCGKTTLLRMLAGLETPDQGRILLDGDDITARPAHDRPINMMFQRYALFPHLNVADNIGFGLKQAGLARGERRRRVEELLALVRLEGLGERTPEQLSGGQQQRVALARALARRPKLLLLDEPLAALDRRLRESTAIELTRLLRETDTTFVMVTHDQDEAMQLSDRIAVMFAGRLAQVGPPREVYARPADRAVASFVGDVNLLPVRELHRSGDALQVQCTVGSFVVANGHAAAAPCLLGVRPERMTLEPASNHINGHVPATVEAHAYHGDVSVYHLRADDGTLLLAKLPNDGQRWHPAPGERVHAGFAADAAFLLEQ